MTPRVLLFGAPSVVQRHELAALLWPEHETKLALTNLRKALFRLQKRPWGATLDVLPGSVRLEADTDVAAFEAAVQAGEHAQALALYAGEWLHGFDDDASEPWTAWLHFERDRCGRRGGRRRWRIWLATSWTPPKASILPLGCWRLTRWMRPPCVP